MFFDGMVAHSSRENASLQMSHILLCHLYLIIGIEHKQVSKNRGVYHNTQVYTSYISSLQVVRSKISMCVCMNCVCAIVCLSI